MLVGECLGGGVVVVLLKAYGCQNLAAKVGRFDYVVMLCALMFRSLIPVLIS